MEVKKRITQSDPHWKLADSSICRVFRILSYQEKMDTDTSFAYNHALSLKICKEIRLMMNPSSRGNLNLKKREAKKVKDASFKLFKSGNFKNEPTLDNLRNVMISLLDKLQMVERWRF